MPRINAGLEASLGYGTETGALKIAAAFLPEAGAADSGAGADAEGSALLCDKLLELLPP